MYRILEIEGEGNRDESDAALERYTFYAEDKEAFSASSSPRIRFKAGAESRQTQDGKRWIDLESRIEKNISINGRSNRLAGKRSSILENLRTLIIFFEPVLRTKTQRLSN